MWTVRFYLISSIPYPDVQKEGLQKFISSGTPAFVAYSFVDITDAKTAQEAVKADAYCLQFVPEKLITADLCKTALQSPNADEKTSKFAVERFPALKMKQIPKEENPQQKAGAEMRF
jgi:hypothetical protein